MIVDGTLPGGGTLPSGALGNGTASATYTHALASLIHETDGIQLTFNLGPIATVVALALLILGSCLYRNMTLLHAKRTHLSQLAQFSPKEYMREHDHCIFVPPRIHSYIAQCYALAQCKREAPLPHSLPNSKGELTFETKEENRAPVFCLPPARRMANISSRRALPSLIDSQSVSHENFRVMVCNVFDSFRYNLLVCERGSPTLTA